jgi:hypothetical protein
VVLCFVVAVAWYVPSAVFGPPAAGAAENPWPHVVGGAFATRDGNGLYVAFADGGVGTIGTARSLGDATGLHLNGPVLSGAPSATGGYWLVASDGGIFGYGGARFYGSMGSVRLNQPVFAMAPTPSGNGYWLVARDGGIFSFGDARFYGSTGSIRLAQPIVGIESSPDGRGYRLVAKDGGVFDFGDARYYGSLPSANVHVSDVVGMATTPTGRGYWIAQANGAVGAFGDAPSFGGYSTLSYDPVAAIATNPVAVGYRLVTQYGATIPFGHAPAGTGITGAKVWYLSQLVCRSSLSTPTDYQAMFDTRGPLWDDADGAFAVDLHDGRRLWLFGDTYVGPSDATTILPGFRFLRNTIAIEHGGCFEFRTGGVFAAVDYLPNPAPGEWYWPMDGVVDPVAGVVRLSAMRVENVPGEPCCFSFRVISNDIVTLDLHSLAYLGSAPMPAAGGVRWGTSMIDDDPTWLYIYGNNANNQRYAARTTRAHLLDGQWQYSTGTGWTTNPTAMRPMLFRTADNQPDAGTSASSPNVERYGTGYILSAKRCDTWWCDDVTAWYSPTPYGPWKAVNSNGGRIATTPAGTGQFTYNGHLVHNANTWMVVWNINRLYYSYNKWVYGTKDTTPANLPPPAALAARK